MLKLIENITLGDVCAYCRYSDGTEEWIAEEDATVRYPDGRIEKRYVGPYVRDPNGPGYLKQDGKLIERPKHPLDWVNIDHSNYEHRDIRDYVDTPEGKLCREMTKDAFHWKLVDHARTGRPFSEMEGAR